jgi:hypothetical protein
MRSGRRAAASRESTAEKDQEYTAENRVLRTAGLERAPKAGVITLTPKLRELSPLPRDELRVVKDSAEKKDQAYPKAAEPNTRENPQEQTGPRAKLVNGIHRSLEPAVENTGARTDGDAP